MSDFNVKLGGRISSLDVLRCISAFFVVLIHAPRGVLGMATRPIEILAVPIFFLLSGYLLYHIDPKQIYAKSKKSLFSLLKLVLGLNLFYFVALYPFRGNPINTWNDLLDLITLGRNIMAILWFLTDMATGMLVILILYKWRWERLLPLSLILLPLIPILSGYVQMYTGTDLIPFGPSYSLDVMKLFHYLPISTPYLYLGMYVRQHEQRLVRSMWVYALLLVSLVGSYLENELFALHKTFVWMYFCTPFLAATILVCFLKNKEFGAGGHMAQIGERYSAYIYYFHPLFMSYLPAVFKRMGTWLGYHSLGVVHLFVTTLIFSILVDYVARKIGPKWWMPYLGIKP